MSNNSNSYHTSLLQFCKIANREQWKQWALKHHPDKGGDSDQYVLVKKDVERYLSASQAEEPAASPTAPTPAPPHGWSSKEQTFVNRLNAKQPLPGQCHGGSFFGHRCPSDHLPNSKFCKSCDQKCHKMLPRDGVEHQCQKPHRPDDLYCTTHSTKPPIPKKVQVKRPCQHMIVTKTGERPCKKFCYGSGDYCSIHRFAHMKS